MDSKKRKVFISNLRKDPKNKKKYFMDEGQEIKVRTNFSGKALEIGFGTIANLLFLQKKGFLGRPPFFKRGLRFF